MNTLNGANPRAATAADFNLDGKTDLAVACFDFGVVSVFLSIFTLGLPGVQQRYASPPVPFPVGTGPNAVIAGDLNGDGRPDLVTTNSNGNTVSVLLNTTTAGASTPSFAPSAQFATGAKPTAAALADVNGDGNRDLVVANLDSGTLSVLLNTTAPGATVCNFLPSADVAVGSTPSSIVLADFEGDGRLDLAVTNRDPNLVTLLLNTTPLGGLAVTFSAPSTFSAASGPIALLAVDVQGDGRIDLVSANASAGSISAFLNTTAPGASVATLAPRSDFAAGSGPAAIVALAANFDGRSDVAVAGAGGVTVLHNATGAGFATASFVPTPALATGGAVAGMHSLDVQLDGRADLVVVTPSDDSIRVLLNAEPVPVVPLQFAATEVVVGDWPSSPNSTVAGDLNNDGRPDVVSALANDNAVNILMNTTPTGGGLPLFTPAAGTALLNFTTPQYVGLADLNGDGRLDLVVTSEGGSVSVLINTTVPGAPIASFDSRADFSVGGAGHAAFGDLNGDGRLDIVVPTGGCLVLLNATPAGGAPAQFVAGSFPSQSNPACAALCDMNRDGRLDIAITNKGSSSVSLFLNAMLPGATTPALSSRTDIGVGSAPVGVSVGDFNMDGLSDLVVANEAAQTITVLINGTTAGASAPAFPIRTDVGAAESPGFIGVRDFTRDGRPDLAVAVRGSISYVSVFPNATALAATTPQFGPRKNIIAGHGTRTVAIIDLNGDGLPDLVAANLDANSVGVYLSE